MNEVYKPHSQNISRNVVEIVDRTDVWRTALPQQQLARLRAFPEYRLYEPKVPVFCVTPTSKAAIHRFYDTSPISPSGRYLAITELPYQDRLPVPGDFAKVVVVDLETGSLVYSSNTMAWDTQVGAHVQWGQDDSELFFNRMDASDWLPFGMKVNMFTAEETRLDGTVYMVSPDGRWALSPCLRRVQLVQPGYGVWVPEYRSLEHRGASANDGVFITDCNNSETRLLLSFKDIHERLEHRFRDINLSSGGFYGFHVKWNPAGDRIMFIMRWLDAVSSRRSTRNYLITFKPDGSELSMAIDAERWKGGHHPTWCSDGEHIIMNLVFRSSTSKLSLMEGFFERVARRIGIRYFSNSMPLRFARFRYDGSGISVLGPSHFGSGHPTLHKDNIHVLADSYPDERVAFGDGTVPLRLLNVVEDTADCVIRIKTLPLFTGPRNELRVDPHPAWDKSGRYVTFNACPDGVRKVYVADFSSIVT